MFLESHSDAILATSSIMPLLLSNVTCLRYNPQVWILSLLSVVLFGAFKSIFPLESFSPTSVGVRIGGFLDQLNRLNRVFLL